MKTPYQPKALIPELQEKLNLFYAKRKVTKEILIEDKGYRLAIYVGDIEVSLNDLADLKG